MRLRTALALLLASLLGTAWTSFGQGPAAPKGTEAAKSRRGPQGFAGPRFGPPGFALRDALDADADGKISAAEMQNAAASLKKLDKNGDGKLDAEEIGWPPRFGRGMPGGGPPGGGRGGPFGPPPFGDRAAGGRSLAERLMARDANRDGKVAKDELPTSMHWLIPTADQDKDGALDQNESRALAERLGLGGGNSISK